MEKLNILPRPKHLKTGDGYIDIKGGLRLVGWSENLVKHAKKAVFIKDEGDVTLEFTLDDGLKREEYRIYAGGKKISVFASCDEGGFRALATLNQIVKGDRIPCFEIADEPDFPARGVMVDVSRNRIYKLGTLKKIVDVLALLKVNQLQLYFEGKPFLYPSFKEEYPPDADVLTGEEILELDRYSAERFIELVPNQNCFGHMTEWLTSFRHLAECPDGFDYYGVFLPPSTLNPSLAESRQFVYKQFADLLPLFSSDKANICGDEPFELGMGASRKICEEKGRGRVYFDFMSDIFEEVERYGKSPMMWGDVFKERYEECKNIVPDNVTVLEWGYNADSFTDEVCELYERAGVNYYLCPGTGLWNTVTGRTDIMLGNVKSAARLGKKHGAAGILMTDWGDGGTCQPLVCSLFAYAVSAAYSWNSEEQDDAVERFVSEVLFSDSEMQIGRIMFDLGNYYKCADRVDDNATKIFKILYVQQTDCMNTTEGNCEPLFTNRDFAYLTPAEYARTREYLEEIKRRLKKVRPASTSAKLYMRELEWATDYLIHGCKLGELKFRQFYREEIENMRDDIARLNREYARLWRIKSKRTGLDESMMRMRSLHRKYKAILG